MPWRLLGVDSPHSARPASHCPTATSWDLLAGKSVRFQGIRSAPEGGVVLPGPENAVPRTSLSEFLSQLQTGAL